MRVEGVIEKGSVFLPDLVLLADAPVLQLVCARARERAREAREEEVREGGVGTG